MKRVKVEIEGITPLMLNRFTDEAMEQAGSGTRSSIRTKRMLPRDDAETRLYKTAKGKPYVPGMNLLACIIEGGKFHKVGKSKVTTMKSTLVTAGIMISDTQVLIDPEEWEVDTRGVVNPATQGRIPRHRPRFDAWKLKFELEVDDEMFDMTLVRAIVDDAGSKIGLGEFRPSRKGMFGRFKVIHWDVEDLAAA